ncbi:glycoside hydrolase family 88 protein [Pedobacter frigiditerrae]|nr:glycoside hydrolase family 88 protein [Pedobacter frigiditerrae]
MKFINSIALLAGFLVMSCSSQRNIPSGEDAVKLAARNYQAYMRDYPDPTKYLRSIDNGKLKATSSSDWTSGFFPGNLWYLYRLTRDERWKDAASKWTAGIEKEKDNKGTHDLGFMMFNSIGLEYELTQNLRQKEALIKGAKSLASRFDPKVGAIKSWDSKPWNYPVIIDNMMNLEYLFWATKATGDSSYYKIAVQHADTDMKYRFRADNTTYHVLDFDAQTGKLLAKKTHQGYADGSCWARGQAWAIYGYTVMYRETRQKKYLDQAVLASSYFLSQTDKIADHIPYWDFNAPGIPDVPRDASAAAIAASAFIEMNKYTGEKGYYLSKAKELLRSLTSQKYLYHRSEYPYFLLDHSTGHHPKNSEIDVPIIYADYYLLEALWRLKQK